MLPLLLRNCWWQLSIGTGAKQGCWLLGGNRDQQVPVLEPDLVSPTHVRELGVSVPKALLRVEPLPDLKICRDSFSFPPKLDKLKSNELVRRKIKSSALL